MSMENLWREVAINKAGGSGGQRKMVDSLTNEAPILASAPVEASSDGLQDVYEVLTSVDSIEEGELDSPLAEVDIATRLDQTNLRQWGAKIRVGEDKLKLMKMAPKTYFAQKTPKILMQTGGRLSRTIYDNLKAYAYNNQVNEGVLSRVINATGSNNTNYSVCAVKWVPSEITTLYNSTGWGNGKVFDIQNIGATGDGGAPALLEDSNGVLGYGTRLKLNSGLKLANSRYVTSIVNIDKGADFASIGLDDKLSEIIEEARGADVLYMHPTLKRLIGSAFKGAFTRMDMNDRGINMIVDSWDGVPIITDYNLDKGTEANVTF